MRRRSVAERYQIFGLKENCRITNAAISAQLGIPISTVMDVWADIKMGQWRIARDQDVPESRLKGKTDCCFIWQDEIECFRPRLRRRWMRLLCHPIIRNEAHNVDCILPTRRSGWVTIQVCGCVSYDCKLPLLHVQGRLIGQRYKDEVLVAAIDPHLGTHPLRGPRQPCIPARQCPSSHRKGLSGFPPHKLGWRDAFAEQEPRLEHDRKRVELHWRKS